MGQGISVLKASRVLSASKHVPKVPQDLNIRIRIIRLQYSEQAGAIAGAVFSSVQPHALSKTLEALLREDANEKPCKLSAMVDATSYKLLESYK